MILEFLFLDQSNREEIKKYRPKGVEVEITDIKDTDFWIIKYSHSRNNADAAQVLSDIHDNLKEYSPLILSCGSSEYYNTKLFPRINILERKLRKLLYLASTISGDSKARKSLDQLEEKSFGDIFNLLFVDENFIRRTKEKVNASNKTAFHGKGQYSKAELIEYLNSLDENTLWDNILDIEDVPTLKKRFREVQKYRNAVMHAHNINTADYKSAHYLFNTINKEFDKALDKFNDIAEKKTMEEKKEIETTILDALLARKLNETEFRGLDNNFFIQFSSFAKNLQKFLNNLEHISEHSIDSEIDDKDFVPAINEMKKSTKDLLKIIGEVEELMETTPEDLVELEKFIKIGVDIDEMLYIKRLLEKILLQYT